MMTARTLLLCSVTAIAAATGAAPGCIDVPEGPAPMCRLDTECDHLAGEVCQEGVCWGNPPPGPFAAVVSPPSTRRDLASREIAVVAINPDGWIEDLALEAPAVLSARLVVSCPPPTTGCETRPLPANITVSRRAQFAGGPGFKTVVTLPNATESFSIPLPRTHAGDEPYTMTIAPSGPAAELVPPLRMPLALTDNTPVRTIVLGAADLPRVTGILSDELGGLRGYRVSALGLWAPSDPATEVSTVAVSDAMGAYSITLAGGLVGTVELVARPPEDVVAPTIRVASIDATRSSPHSVVVPANLGVPVELVVKVSGPDLGGTVAAVPGAVVTVSGQINSSVTSFAISDQQVTDKNGAVTLRLLNGPGLVASYKLSVIPPASSTLGVAFDQEVSLDPGALRTTIEKRLAMRLALRGRIIDHDGAPLNHAAVTAQPSLRFLWALEEAPQAFLAAVPPSTTVTPETGEFVLWVDSTIGQVWGDYELVIEPPATTRDAATRAAAFVKSGVGVRGASTTYSVSDIVLPDPAFVHGRVTGPGGEAVDGAELKLYTNAQLGQSLCAEVPHAPLSCPIPAQLLGRNTSDAEGIVRLALPRP